MFYNREDGKRVFYYKKCRSFYFLNCHLSLHCFLYPNLNCRLFLALLFSALWVIFWHYCNKLYWQSSFSAWTQPKIGTAKIEQINLSRKHATKVEFDIFTTKTYEGVGGMVGGKGSKGYSMAYSMFIKSFKNNAMCFIIGSSCNIDSAARRLKQKSPIFC